MSILFGGSILAAFIAGMIALFAPCCISVMMPAYFAGAFQNKRQIIAMTLIFAAGIATVILPLVIGASYLINLINAQHTLVYFLGGLFMLGLGMFILLGGKIHLPMKGRAASNKTGPLSVYSLGVFSGVASACCAPVLAGVIALSTFANTFVLVILLGIAYVLGMVIPLLIISLFWTKLDLQKSKLFKPKKFSYKLGPIKRTINGTALASGLLLTIVGSIAIHYGLSTRNMSEPSEWQYNVVITLQKVSNYVNSQLAWVPNWLSALVVILVVLSGLIITVRQFSNTNKGEVNDEKEN